MKRREGMSPFKAGAITLIVLAVIIFFGFTKANPFANRFELKAAFKTANDIRPGSPVRIAGVQVGKVTAVEAADGYGQGAVVTMELESKGLPVKADATAKIRPRIFLEGNYFVDLKPGSPSGEEVNEGHTLPVQQTASPVQYGQLLNVFQADTRKDLQKVLREYGSAVTGEGGRGFNRSIPYWEPAFRNTARANTAALGKLQHDLSGYIAGAAKFAEGLDRDRTALKELVTGFATTAGALAAEQARLTEAIGALPEFLESGEGALRKLDASFPPLRRFVADLRPAVRASLPNVTAGVPFARQARGLMSQAELGGLARDLRRAVPALSRVNRGGVDLQGQLRLLGSCQNEVILPTITKKIPDQSFPATGPVYEEAVKWLPGIAGESRSFDANGQWVKSLAYTANYAYPLLDGRFQFTQAPLQGINPPKAPQPAYRPDVPCETQKPTDLRSEASDPPEAIKVNHGSAAAQARYAKARDAAVQWLRGQLEDEGLAGELKVSSKDLTADSLKLLKRPFKRGSR